MFLLSIGDTHSILHVKLKLQRFVIVRYCIISDYNAHHGLNQRMNFLKNNFCESCISNRRMSEEEQYSLFVLFVGNIFSNMPILIASVIRCARGVLLYRLVSVLRS